MKIFMLICLAAILLGVTVMLGVAAMHPTLLQSLDYSDMISMVAMATLFFCLMLKMENY